ncbi:MAG: leucyl aminopeptidase family protein [Vampirovibrionales bacterium]|nr:leucyl aminopeptidase family protein [Vampirovibrionales bacterium]
MAVRKASETKTGVSPKTAASAKTAPAHHLAFSYASGAYESVTADALIVGVFSEKAAEDNGSAKSAEKNAEKKESEKKSYASTPALKALDKALSGAISTVAPEEKFEGASGQLLMFRKLPGAKVNARRVILLGLGEASKLNAKGLDKAIQKAIASVSGFDKMAHIALALPSDISDQKGLEALSFEVALQTAVDAAAQCVYYSQEALPETQKKKQALKKITLLLNRPATAEDKAILKIGEVMARARAQCKDLVNKPPNIKRTDTLVEGAKALAKKTGITVTVQSDVRWIEKNMPCFFAVAKGSLLSDPPKFIHIAYKPQSKSKNGKAKKKIALIGKSVIFDTGGYQVKTGNYMNTMKGDMTGGAVMLSAMAALAELQLPNIEVHAYMAATPNKIDTDAFLPDSIYPSTCGKFVEIRHTDAEGRLTLIDAVAKAYEQKPDEMVVMATLTGSAAQAVGMSIALMGNNDDLVGRVLKAAERHCEPIQSLKVTEDDYANIKSKLDGADIINTNSGKGRGAQTAAAFVMSGAPKSLPIAHLDIAGADMTSDEKATGIGQKTIIQYLLSENAALSASKVVAGKGKK